MIERLEQRSFGETGSPLACSLITLQNSDEGVDWEQRCMLGYSAVLSPQFCRCAPSVEIWESIITSVTLTEIPFKIVTIIPKSKMSNMCVFFLSVSSIQPRTSSKNRGTHCSVSLYISKPKWRFLYLIWRKSQHWLDHNVGFQLGLVGIVPRLFLIWGTPSSRFS